MPPTSPTIVLGRHKELDLAHAAMARVTAIHACETSRPRNMDRHKIQRNAKHNVHSTFFMYMHYANAEQSSNLDIARFEIVLIKLSITLVHPQSASIVLSLASADVLVSARSRVGLRQRRSIDRFNELEAFVPDFGGHLYPYVAIPIWFTHWRKPTLILPNHDTQKQCS